MIKSNVTVCGVVSKKSSSRTNKEGKPFVTLTVDVVIAARSGINKTVAVQVIKDGTITEVGDYWDGERVEVTGVMTIKKRGDQWLFNLRADSVKTVGEESKDGITGDIEFRGKVGKNIEEKQDKKGKPFLVFSAFSTEKNGEEFEFTWVRFLRFDGKREDWLQQGARVSVKGAMELSVYNDRLDISCRVAEMGQFVPQPSPVGRENTPFGSEK